MAGDWIKMRTDLAEDPAVIGIAIDTDLDEDAVVGKLHRFWSLIDRQSRDGHVPNVTQAWLDRFLGVTGFAQAMQKHGWLDLEPGGATVPKFDRHNSKPAKSRALAANRKSRQRHAQSVTQTGPQKRREEGEYIRPDLQTARLLAPQVGVTPSEAQSWWEAREASDWMKATGGQSTTPVGSNWQADLKRFVEHERDRKQREKSQRSARGKRNRNEGTVHDGTTQPTAPRPPGV